MNSAPKPRPARATWIFRVIVEQPPAGQARSICLTPRCAIEHRSLDFLRGARSGAPELLPGDRAVGGPPDDLDEPGVESPPGQPDMPENGRHGQCAVRPVTDETKRGGDQR